ncbi:hypothetical protein NOM01_01760 [Sporolactobacillus sp. STSJ-5]|uniref:hypothetical protein n=1 Tax=Sporolactobacillus sp. STSJ-5 TaxID=2965076 RepID=UPI002105C7F9|nr:hypothetical protein [Sporolactobacillus sp. STSJ-5]MCQ2008713.1 hypothetical protein [Sporolactobacillus sp. STSJ-5]
MCTLLYLSYFVFLFIFFIFVLLRIPIGANVLLYLLIFFPSVMPFIIIYLDQSKEEKKKAEKMEKEAN